MEGNVVTASKWLGGSLVLSSLILVIGPRWVPEPGNQAMTMTSPAVTPPPPLSAQSPFDHAKTNDDLQELTRIFRQNQGSPPPSTLPSPNRRGLFQDLSPDTSRSDSLGNAAPSSDSSRSQPD